MSETYTLGSGKPAPNPHAVVQREKFIGFARDAASAALLHEAFAGCLPNNNRIHMVDFRACLAILGAMTTPETILVDLSGEDQPMNAMMELADAVELGTTVLAIGDIHNVNFYRTVTKGMGVKEYLAKPLTPSAIEQNFLPIIGGMADPAAAPRGGRLVTICGARGGVGASTIATSLAWLVGNHLHRHTALLDAELHTGTLALGLNLSFNNGLSVALESPERVDQLLIERSMQPAGDRLHVLASQHLLSRDNDHEPGAARALIQALAARYNFIIADTGARLSPLARDLSFSAQQRVIVMDPSMISIRNMERLLTLPAQSPRVITVLNKAGTPGGLAQSYIEQAMGLRFDAVIPDLPRIVPKSTQFGEQVVSLRGPFRDAIAALATALGATAGLG